MSLIKKTIILLKNTPCGYVTVVRVGDETGAKIVGDDFRKGYTAYLKIGNNIMRAEIEGKRSEIPVSIPFNSVDDVGCAVYDNAKLIAKGGKDISEREIPLPNEKTTVVDEQSFSERNQEKITKKIEASESESKTETVVSSENVATDEDGKIEKAEKTNENAENTTKIAENKSNKTRIAEDIKERGKGENDDGKESKETVTEREIDEVVTEHDDEKKDVVAEGNNTSDITRESDTTSEEQEMLNRLSQGKTDFYIGISDKVDEMFVVYPREEKLSSVIPDSEWVKINYDGDDYYVVGRLKDKGKVKYLGYGVPGVKGIRPPKIADDITNWFPLVLDGYDGYWLFFQDAETGKID